MPWLHRVGHRWLEGVARRDCGAMWSVYDGHTHARMQHTHTQLRAWALQVLYRLQEKRFALEKEVLKFGEAPAGIKEVFELCRGFERAYTSFINVRGQRGGVAWPHRRSYPSCRTAALHSPCCRPGNVACCCCSTALQLPCTVCVGRTELQESPVASKIKESFLSEKGLAGKVKKLPFDKVFELKNVKAVGGGGRWGAGLHAREHPYVRFLQPTPLYAIKGMPAACGWESFKPIVSQFSRRVCMLLHPMNRCEHACVAPDPIIYDPPKPTNQPPLATRKTTTPTSAWRRPCRCAGARMASSPRWSRPKRGCGTWAARRSTMSWSRSTSACR